MSDMTPLERMARAIEDATNNRPFGLYDYSSYPGSEPPHVVRDETKNGKIVFRSNTPVPAQLEHERLTRNHIARAALMAIREPTDDMLAPACKKHKPGEPMSENSPFECPAFTKRRSRWTAMIDHVLKEGEG
jgi:hypothetical protein